MTQVTMTLAEGWLRSQVKRKFKKKCVSKKHPENIDTSTSVTFDLDACLRRYVKVKKKAYVIRCQLLYHIVPGMMSVDLIVF